MLSDNLPFSDPAQTCSRERAAALIAQMLSGFPQQEANDPEGYIVGLITIALQYPEEAVRIVTERSFQFLPTRYEWRQAIDYEAERLIRVRAAQNARAYELPTAEYVPLRFEPDPEPDPVTGKHLPGTMLRQYGRWVGLYGRPYERTT